MRKLIFFAIIFSSCAPRITDNSKSAVRQIIDTDKEMSNTAGTIGFSKTLLLYADDEVIKPRDNQAAIIGKNNLEKAFAGREGMKNISWVPYRAEASRSGDFGYTYGHYTISLKDSTIYGDYITIWKRQVDGKWKFVLDTGNATPKP